MPPLLLLPALLAPAWTGYHLLRPFWPPKSGAWSTLLRITAGVLLGFAVNSALFFAWRATSFPFGCAYFTADGVLLPIAAWWIGHRFAPPTRASATSTPSSWRQFAVYALLISATVWLVAFFLYGAAVHVAKEPLGYWDAWAIWNLKARFLFLGGPHWTHLFSREIWFSHPDYPLLLPAHIARLWTYLGHESDLAPQVTTIAIALLTLLLLFSAVALLRGVPLACLAVVLLAGSEKFLYYAGSQYADIVLSAFALASVALLAASGRFPDHRARLLLASGLLAGFGAFVKNEGLVICVALLAASAITGLLGRARLLPSREVEKRPGSPGDSPSRWPVLLLALGMLPGLAITGGQKLTFSAESYLVADQEHKAAPLQKALDPDRHRTIASHLFRQNLGWQQIGPEAAKSWFPNHPMLYLLALFILIRGVAIDPHDRSPAATIALTLLLSFLAYCAVFLVMPYNLAGLMESFPRVQLHLWPAAIFVVLLVLRPMTGLGYPARPGTP